ncbi:hypothetical protein BWQ96_09321 [Gracilariopsis chorda]|uniref:Uncharacterized protein n=1 Tax=Gracilariopsis chorda TaxID=448386 RepID=A0A2V3IFV2_9FLOR|nr:hypothetical protein BWQ96_09321 [Gracilariopsis chorda]|eukprot:PXF40966.1 hypothetical protein BWQ96_09321 [Gracilariopsis chorda]
MISALSVLTLLAPFASLYYLIKFQCSRLPLSNLSKQCKRRQILRGLVLLPAVTLLVQLWKAVPYLPFFVFSFVFQVGIPSASRLIVNAGFDTAHRFLELVSDYKEVGEYLGRSTISPRGNSLLNSLMENLTRILTEDGGIHLIKVATQKWQHYQDALTQSNEEHFSNLINNLTSLPLLSEMGNNATAAITYTLEAVRLSDLFPRAQLSPRSQQKFLAFTTALSQSINSSSAHLFALNSTKPERLESSVHNVWQAAKAFQDSLQLETTDILGDQTLSPGATVVLDRILRVMDGRSTVGDALKSSLESVTNGGSTLFRIPSLLSTWMLQIALMLVVLWVVSIPLMMMTQSLLQLWLQWQLVKKYKEEVSDAERNMEGWILTGWITGVMYATVQTIWRSVEWATSNSSFLGLLAFAYHFQVLHEIHGTAMVAIASAEGRKDVLNGWRARRTWWMAAVILTSSLKVWWDFHLVTMIGFLVLGNNGMAFLFIAADGVVSLALQIGVRRMVKRAKKDENEYSKHD